MVLSTLSDSKRYYSMHPLFERAFEFYSQTGRNFDEGRHSIEGDDLILIISNGAMRPADEAPLEAHNKYIDIQIVISGTESYGVRDRRLCKHSDGGYDSERDIEFFYDEFSNLVTLSPEDFVIFFPEDAHAPLIGRGDVKKAIFKIKL